MNLRLEEKELSPGRQGVKGKERLRAICVGKQPRRRAVLPKAYGRAVRACYVKKKNNNRAALTIWLIIGGIIAAAVVQGPVRLWTTKREVARILGIADGVATRQPNPQELAMLSTWIHNTDPIVRANAIATLRLVADKYGCSILPHDCFQELSQAAISKDASTRREAVRALGAYGLFATNALRQLNAQLGDYNSDSAWFALNVISQLGTNAAESINPILDGIAAAQRDTSNAEPYFLRYGAHALGNIGVATPNILNALKGLMLSHDHEARFYAIVAFMKLQPDSDVSFSAIQEDLKLDSLFWQRKLLWIIKDSGVKSKKLNAILSQLLGSDDESLRVAAKAIISQ